ncbi:MAG: lysophospholipid acyltransferase family protein [Gemmatimonadetes bacterium]|nr:lysophospholipid acyltransferase family protein [Gemmatimonadota bacterium]
MKLSHRLEYAGLRVLMSLTRRLAPVRASRVGDVLGALAFHVPSMRKKLVMEHMARVFGMTGDSEELRAMSRSVYRQLGRTAVEHARLLAGRTADLRDRLDVLGEDHVGRALEGGRGVILITGHFGYWELLGATVAMLGYPITVVAKKLHNPAVDRLVHAGRERLGMAVATMDKAPATVYRALRRNECVGLLADQDAGAGGVFVDFLGMRASTYQGPAQFALRTGAPIVPCFIIRSGPERHRVCFETPIEAIPTGDEPADLARITQAYTDVLARYILEYPDHWFWVHRRWKTPASDDTNHVK